MAIPVELSDYLAELVRRLSTVVDLDAVYLVGSAAQDTYEHGRSDVDVIAVVGRPSSRTEKEALAEAAASIPCPARKLELVVYARGEERHELNVNTGEPTRFDPDDDPGFWFVLDRAIAEQHAVPLLGPPWEEMFATVPQEAIARALEEAETFRDWDDQRGAELAAERARVWRESGRWISKAEAAQRA